MGLGSLQQNGDDVYSSKQVTGGCGDYPSKSYLSCIENVIGFKDGGILVRWASGFTSKVGPYEIIGINKHDDSALTPVFQNDDEDSSTQEMVKYDKQPWQLEDKTVLEKKAVDYAGEDDDKKEIWESISLLLPRAAVGFSQTLPLVYLASLVPPHFQAQWRAVFLWGLVKITTITLTEQLQKMQIKLDQIMEKK